jgi:hypothetical protein
MLSAGSDSLPDVSRSETSDTIGGEDGTSVGKDLGMCIVWEKDFAGVKSSLVKRVSLKGKMPVVSPSGHGVVSFPNQVSYSHASPVGTAEDLSSQTTKLSDHVKGQVIRITCKVM